MEKATKTLTRAEMKTISGGTGMKTIWHCQDTPSSPFMTAGTCASSDPAVYCSEYSCIDSGVSCTGGEYCP